MSPSAALQEQLANLSPQDRRALVLVSVFLTVVFVYVWLFEPLVLRYQQASEDLAGLQVEQRRFEQKVRMLPKREARLEEYKRELTDLQRHFRLTAAVPETIVPMAIAEMNYYARLCDVDIAGIRPLEAQTTGEYQELPFDVEATAKFEALHKFFYYIETSPSVLSITDLELALQERKVRARLKVSAVIKTRPDQTPLATGPQVEQRHRLQILIPHWTGVAPLAVAAQQGFLDSERFSVELISSEDSVTTERLLLAGEADGTTATLFELLDYWSRGIGLQAVLPISAEWGARGLVVRDDLDAQGIEDLQSEPIGVEKNGVPVLVLHRALRSAGLSLEDVKLVSIDPEQVARDLANGTLNAGVTRDPYLTDLLDQGAARLIFSSARAEASLLDLLILRKDTVKKKPEVIRFLIQAVRKSARFIEENPDLAARIIADWQQQPAELTQRTLDKFFFYGFSDGAELLQDEVLKQQIENQRYHFNLMDRPFPLVAPADITAPRFLREVLGVAPEGAGP